MLILDDLRYSEEHVWVRYEDNHTVTLGITDFAQFQLGEFDYVELSNEGDEIIAYVPLGSIESDRVFNDLYSPVSGRVVSVNRAVIEKPTLMNESPYNEGWIIRVKLSNLQDLDTLMSADDYEEYILPECLSSG